MTSGSRAGRRGHRWRAAACLLLSSVPLLAHAGALAGVRVLPHRSDDYGFSGWQSEGEVPAALEVPVELGDHVYGATLQLQPREPGGRWRVRVQYETSLGLDAEGPHWDLTGWKHCVSHWAPAGADGPLTFVLPAPSPEQQECFPAYTPAELDQAVREHARAQGDPAQAQWWLDHLRTPSAQTAVTPFVAISAVRVKVEMLRQGRWVEVTTVTFLPAMGC